MDGGAGSRQDLLSLRSTPSRCSVLLVRTTSLSFSARASELLKASIRFLRLCFCFLSPRLFAVVADRFCDFEGWRFSGIATSSTCPTASVDSRPPSAPWMPGNPRRSHFACRVEGPESLELAPGSLIGRVGPLCFEFGCHDCCLLVGVAPCCFGLPEVVEGRIPFLLSWICLCLAVVGL